jgi:hypothetical protein
MKLLAIGAFVYLLVKSKMRWLSLFQATQKLDEFNQDKADTYQNAFELYQNKTIEKDILEKILQPAIRKAENQDMQLNREDLKFSGLISGILLIATLIFLIFTPAQFFKGWNFFLSLSMPARQHKTFLEIEPGNISIQRNSHLQIQVLDPEMEVEHRFLYKIEDIWREEALIGFQRRFDNLDFSFDYFIKTPYAVSDTFRIEVFELPAVKELTLHYNFPAYTKLGSEIEKNSNGFIKAITGTDMTLDLEANNPLNECRLIFSDGSTGQSERQGRSSFRFQFKVSKSMNYHFYMVDFLGNNSQKIEKSILVIEDKKPEIKIIKPGKDTLLTKNMLLPLTIFASDDYGLENLVIHHFINQQEEQRKQITKRFEETSLQKEYIFDLSNTFLLPGDKVTYWLSIQDNSPIRQTAFSQRYLARFPSIEEIYQEIEAEEKQKKETLQTALERSKQMQEEFEQKRREMLKKQEFDWQDKKDIEAFLKEQEKLNEDVKNVAQEYQKMIESLEKNQALNPETLEKMEKIKELMDEIANEQLLEAMKNLQEKMDKMSPEEVKKAMENMKFSLEDFDKKLEQTIKLLEDIKKEQAMQKALEISKEMETMQNDLNERTKKEHNDKLAEDQKQIQDKLTSLENQLEKADALFDEKKDADLKQMMKELMEQISQDELQKDLEDSAEQLQNKDMKMAMQTQKQAASKMKKMTKKMEDMMNMMGSNSMEDMTEMIDKTILRLLLLSELQNQSKMKYHNDPYLIFHEQIANFEGLKIALQQLYSVPMIVLALGPKFIYDASFTISTYQEMFQEITNAKNRQVPGFLDEIQKGYNLMIYDLMQAKNNMQSGGGGSGGMQSLLQSMQQMGEQQMMINMLTQQLLQQIGQEGSMSQDMRNQARKLAEQEERLAENLKRLLQTDKEAQKQTAALNQIAEDLKEISRMLSQNKIDPSLMDRQERILSRLLDAQKSIHKREFSKKREGESGEKQDWLLPAEIKLRFDKIRREALLKQELNSYPKAFQDLIREYYKKVNEKAGDE